MLSRSSLTRLFHGKLVGKVEAPVVLGRGERGLRHGGRPHHVLVDDALPEQPRVDPVQHAVEDVLLRMAEHLVLALVAHDVVVEHEVGEGGVGGAEEGEVVVPGLEGAEEEVAPPGGEGLRLTLVVVEEAGEVDLVVEVELGVDLAA